MTNGSLRRPVVQDHFDLSRLDPLTFEHLANAIVRRVLGNGLTSFGPGRDGGRDGYFEGEANYPSPANRWGGVWYIQSKYKTVANHDASSDWLVARVREEFDAFRDSARRRLPDNIILVTNVLLTPVPVEGSFDRINALAKDLADHRGSKINVHVWGGDKVVDLLRLYPEVAEAYLHLVSPGHVLSEIIRSIDDRKARPATLRSALLDTPFRRNIELKLGDASDNEDTKPPIHKTFVDLPARWLRRSPEAAGRIAPTPELHAAAAAPESSLRALLCLSSSCSSAPPIQGPVDERWKEWTNHPRRARAWFLLGGPGQGKSTVGQFMAQVHRAALLLRETPGHTVSAELVEGAKAVLSRAEELGVTPIRPRLPVLVDLKEYSAWLGELVGPSEPNGILSYIAVQLTKTTQAEVTPNMLRDLFRACPTLALFDGFDEVPPPLRLSVGEAIGELAQEVWADGDSVVVVTSRPQGYAGELSSLEPMAEVELTRLDVETSCECARRLVLCRRDEERAEAIVRRFEDASANSSIRPLLGSPLQVHVVTLLLLEGVPLPEKRSELLDSLFQALRRREAAKNHPDEKLSELFQKQARMLRVLHEQLGMELHIRAEDAAGARSSMTRTAFRHLVRRVVSEHLDSDVEDWTDVLMRAARERLMLMSTPDSGDQLRFDVRQVQEYFAARALLAEFGESGRTERRSDMLRRRLTAVVPHAHWREVVLFALEMVLLQGASEEVLVAHDVLLALDGSAEPTEQFDRILARGTLLVAKLVTNGAFEGPKHNRTRFAELLGRAATVRAAEAVAGLARVEQPQSRGWVSRSLFAACRREDFSAPGWTLLWNLVEDQDDFVAEVEHAFSEDPRRLLHLNEVLAWRRRSGEMVLKPWQCRVVASALRDERAAASREFSSAWFEMYEQCVPVVAAELGIDIDQCLRMGAKLGYFVSEESVETVFVPCVGLFVALEYTTSLYRMDESDGFAALRAKLPDTLLGARVRAAMERIAGGEQAKRRSSAGRAEWWEMLTRFSLAGRATAGRERRLTSIRAVSGTPEGASVRDLTRLDVQEQWWVVDLAIRSRGQELRREDWEPQLPALCGLLSAKPAMVFDMPVGVVLDVLAKLGSDATALLPRVLAEVPSFYGREGIGAAPHGARPVAPHEEAVLPILLWTLARRGRIRAEADRSWVANQLMSPTRLEELRRSEDPMMAVGAFGLQLWQRTSAVEALLPAFPESAVQQAPQWLRYALAQTICQVSSSLTSSPLKELSLCLDKHDGQFILWEALIREERERSGSAGSALRMDFPLLAF